MVCVRGGGVKFLDGWWMGFNGSKCGVYIIMLKL